MVGVDNVTDPADPDHSHWGIVAYDYTAGGRMVGKRWGPNATVSLDFTAGAMDNHGRITRMAFVAGGRALNDTQYGHDKVGNRLFSWIEQIGHKNDRSYLYEYDRLHRLVQAGRGALDDHRTGFDSSQTVIGKSWNLDVLGNFNGSPDDALSVVEYKDVDRDNAFDRSIDSVLGSDHHVTNLNNEITKRVTEEGHTTVSFAYDPAGNLLRDDKHKYTYDAWNRIVDVVRLSDGVNIARYDYDALGRRVRKQVDKCGKLDTPAPGQLFYYDGNRIIDQYNGDGKASTFFRSFVYGLQYIDEIVAQFESDVLKAEVECYILQDANYTVVAAVNNKGELIQQYARTPYGKLYAVDDKDGHAIDFEHEPEKIVSAFGHQGLWDDLETGLVYNRARYYRPEIGRFLQRDPNQTGLIMAMTLVRNAQSNSVMSTLSARAQYADGLSLYQYVRGNPLRALDPDGRFSFGLSEPLTTAAIWAASYGIVYGPAIAKGVGFVTTALALYGAYQQGLSETFRQLQDEYAMDLARGVHPAEMLLPEKTIWRTAGNGTRKLWRKSKGGAVDAWRWFMNLICRKGVSGLDDEARDLATATASATVRCRPPRLAKWWQNTAWTPKRVNGAKVYQRDDLFDPSQMTTWRERGDVVHGTNLERMRTGRSPIGHDNKAVNLHHVTQDADGALAEVQATTHQTYFSILHLNTGTLPSGINRSEFNRWREEYWILRANDF